MLENLEECLTFDLQLFADTCPARVAAIVGRKEGEEEEEDGGGMKGVEDLACLPCDLLLKVSALCILSSYSLRKQGGGGWGWGRGIYVLQVIFKDQKISTIAVDAHGGIYLSKGPLTHFISFTVRFKMCDNCVCK